MADIRLKDVHGTSVVYEGVSTIKLPLADGTGVATFYQQSGQGGFFEISTEEEMTNILVNATPADSGKIYLYTGPTGKYITNAYYKLEAVTMGGTT